MALVGGEAGRGGDGVGVGVGAGELLWEEGAAGFPSSSYCSSL